MTTPDVRQANDADMRFVHSSWHTSYWKVWAHKYVDRETYSAGQDRRIDRLMFRSVVLVAFFPEVPDEVLGWACLEGSTCHYVYVKGSYRRSGIATGLVYPRAKCYTHQTDAQGRAFASKVGMQFNPYKMEQT